MIYEKRKLLIHRAVWFVLFLLGIIITIALTHAPTDNGVYISIFIYIDFVIFLFFIASLLLSCKVYDYNGYEIVVYAGFYHHYIKVNGRKVDEHDTVISFTAILLSCTLNDGTDMQATITMTNRISLKINNQLYRERDEYVR